MSVHVVELDLVRSNANRALLIGYLLGVVQTTKACLEAGYDCENLSANIELRLKEIYPLIQKEFPGTNLVPSEETDRIKREIAEQSR